MIPFFTIQKRYSINTAKSIVIERLNNISSTKSYDSKYSVYGECLSIDPPIFVFKTNTPAGSNPAIKMAATTVVVQVTNENEKMVINARTKPNWIFLIGFWLLITLSLIKMLLIKNSNDIWILISYLVLAIACIFLDKLFKNILLASFERDIKF